jgi:hypothetical protein
MRVAVIGAGPAGLAVVEALLARPGASGIAIDWLERAPRPDGVLRYGPSAGGSVLRELAVRLATVLADRRVRFCGSVEVGVDLPWADLRRHCPQVVLATGAPGDLPLRIPGVDAVGISTLTHLRAGAAGSPDVYRPAIDPMVDSAAVLAPTAAAATELLASVRRVELLTHCQPIALVGRHRIRAVRVAVRATDGRLRIRDVRAQLVLRAHDPHSAGPGLPVDEPGVHVAGWSGRDPAAGGSHARDAAAVAGAVFAAAAEADRHARGADADPGVPWPRTGPADWSPVAEVESLLARFAGEGARPTADYDQLLAGADDD